MIYKKKFEQQGNNVSMQESKKKRRNVIFNLYTRHNLQPECVWLSNIIFSLQMMKPS
jgi:hypothetical protein